MAWICCAGAMAQIPADSQAIRYVGRTMTAPDHSVSFDWGGTHFITMLKGGKLSARLSCSGDCYLNVFADGVLKNTIEVCSKDTLIELISDINKKQSRITVQKRTEGEYGRLTVHNFVLPKSGSIAAPPAAKNNRHIEFIGNSLTSGFGTEGKDKTEPFKVSTENCNIAYGSVISRYFDAEYTFISHSGQGAVRNYGDEKRTSTLCMRERMMRTFDMDTLLWTNGSYHPQLVVINLGTNDFTTEPHPYRSEFVDGYLKLIKQVRQLYGNIPILCVCPPTISEPLPQYIDEVKQKANDPKVFVQHLTYGLYNDSDDLGSVSHPNKKGQLKMAMALIPYISTITGWDVIPGKPIE